MTEGEPVGGIARLTTRVTFFTDAHRIVAEVDTRQRRLVEMLRDPSRSFLDLTDVSLSRTVEPGVVLATNARGILRKSDIQFAAIVAEPNRTTQRLYNFVEKKSVRVLAILPAYGIEGGMPVTYGSADGLVAYQKISETFIHLTDALVRFTRESLPPKAVDTVIINRQLVELFCLVA